jgi:hypothetical protein
MARDDIGNWSDTHNSACWFFTTGYILPDALIFPTVYFGSLWIALECHYYAHVYWISWLSSLIMPDISGIATVECCFGYTA